MGPGHCGAALIWTALGFAWRDSGLWDPPFSRHSWSESLPPPRKLVFLLLCRHPPWGQLVCTRWRPRPPTWPGPVDVLQAVDRGQVTDCRLPLRAGLRVQKREAWASPGAPVMAPGTARSHCTRITAPGSLPSLASFPHSNVILMLHPTVSISRVKQMEQENKPSGAATPPALSASTVHQKNGSFRQALR